LADRCHEAGWTHDDLRENKPMRTIRRLVLLAILGVGGVTAFNYVSDTGWPRVSRAAVLDAEQAKQKATRIAYRAAAKASNAADHVGDSMGESALTAKIKSKMALDDRVNARAIDVDTSGSVVTLRGVVRSRDERSRAVRLARETQGITKVIDHLRVASN
jgi:osmotically-inducible protein OsmY